MAIITSEYDITIKIGGDFEEEFTLGFDITGWGIKSQIRTKQRLSAPLVADFAVTVVESVTGRFKISLTDVETSGITTRRKQCAYDILLTNPMGLDEYYIKGAAIIEQSVTVK